MAIFVALTWHLQRRGLPDSLEDRALTFIAARKFSRVDPDGQTLAFEGLANFRDDRVVRSRV